MVRHLGLAELVNEKRAFGLVLFLIALPLVAFLPRVLAGRTDAPVTPEPAWLNLLLVTVGTWPLEDGRPDLSEPRLVERLEAYGSILATYTPSHLGPVAAASMLTGLRPTTTGVRAEGDRLAPGTWTLASGYRDLGGATAAFLAEPLVSATGIEGFELLDEGPGLTPAELAERTVAFWAGETERPTFVWLHLEHAGEGGAKVDELLEHLDLSVARTCESVVILTALGSDGPIAVDSDAGFRVPFLAALPGDMHAGSRSGATALLTDLPLFPAAALRMSRPAGGLDASDSIVASFQGVANHRWMLLEGPDGHVVRRDMNRMTAPGPAPADPAQARFWKAAASGQDSGFEPADRPNGRQLYRRILDEKIGVTVGAKERP